MLKELYTSTRMFLTKFASLEVEVVMGRQILGMLLTMYLPTTLMNIIGHATNYMKRFFFEAQVILSMSSL